MSLLRKLIARLTCRFWPAPWTAEDDLYLVRLGGRVDVSTAADHLNRSEDEVVERFAHLRLSGEWDRIEAEIEKGAS